MSLLHFLRKWGQEGERKSEDDAAHGFNLLTEDECVYKPRNLLISTELLVSYEQFRENPVSPLLVFFSHNACLISDLASHKQSYPVAQALQHELCQSCPRLNRKEKLCLNTFSHVNGKDTLTFCTFDQSLSKNVTLVSTKLWFTVSLYHLAAHPVLLTPVHDALRSLPRRMTLVSAPEQCWNWILRACPSVDGNKSRTSAGTLSHVNPELRQTL